LQPVTLLAGRGVMHRTPTQIEIVDMVQGMKTSGTQKDKAYPEISTHPSYQSTSIETLYQKLPKQRW
jgi:hypothetical protein